MIMDSVVLRTKSRVNRWRSVAVALLFLVIIGPSAVSYSASRPAAVSGTVTLLNAKSKDPSNVVVWLESATARSPRSNDTVVLRQQNKQFIPRVVVSTVGQKVDFPNSDPFPHNVFSNSEVKRFDLGLYQAGETRLVPITRPGVIPVFCNIHPQMKAFIVALKTPYYGVSQKSGDIQISDVPPGSYRLKVWHERAKPEKLEELSRQVTVSGSGLNLGNIQIDESGFFAIPHKNKDNRDYAPGN
jgi:plastocyanin